ncbi:MAG: hypothetical protein IJD38_03980 [Clostridia bacterium]|nr:hypothetical protein [Clostridia bacterium]
MDRSRFAPRLCFMAAAVLTLLGAVIRTVCFLTAYDSSTGYLNPGFLTTLSTWLYFITPAVLIAVALMIPKDTLPSTLNQKLRAPSAILVALGLAAFSAVVLIRFAPAKGNILLAPALLGIPAALYYGISATRNGRYPDWLSLLGFIPVFWCITAVADLYFDHFVTMNSPVKVSLQVGLMGFMVAMLGELRFRIGRPLPRVASVFFGISGYTCLTAAIPLLVATGARVLSHPLHLMYAIVLLTAGLYSLYLLFQYTCLPLPVESTEAQASATESDSTAQ